MRYQPTKKSVQVTSTTTVYGIIIEMTVPMPALAR